LKIVKHRYDIDITSNKIRESKIGYITWTTNKEIRLQSK
jgi:hypothetical protein